MRVISGTARGTNLYSLNDKSTRPTLDRIKESLFNIIGNRIRNSNVLDLFSGSGAISIEFLSRGSSKVVLCDKSKECINIINKNLEKTRLKEKAIVINASYEKCLENIKSENMKFDIIFLDPPYESDYIMKSINIICKYKLLSDDGIIIMETDEDERILREIENEDINIYDFRKYGRVKLIFANRKG